MNVIVYAYSAQQTKAYGIDHLILLFVWLICLSLIDTFLIEIVDSRWGLDNNILFEIGQVWWSDKNEGDNY